MISKSEIKLITSLHRKKYRNRHNLFIAEGEKLIKDLLVSGLELTYFYTTETPAHWANQAIRISERDLEKISAQKHPNGWLAVFKKPSSCAEDSDWVIALDEIQDPGNLGTILRLCDWFGMPNLICSEGTVDAFNPKVVQASMGSIARVNLQYVNLNQWLTAQTKPIFGAVLDGVEVTQLTWPDQGVLLLGNEGQGIGPFSAQHITDRISIAGHSKRGAESLNVAMAASILLHEWQRQ